MKKATLFFNNFHLHVKNVGSKVMCPNVALSHVVCQCVKL